MSFSCCVLAVKIQEWPHGIWLLSLQCLFGWQWSPVPHFTLHVTACWIPRSSGLWGATVARNPWQPPVQRILKQSDGWCRRRFVNSGFSFECFSRPGICLNLSACCLMVAHFISSTWRTSGYLWAIWGKRIMVSIKPSLGFENSGQGKVCASRKFPGFLLN